MGMIEKSVSENESCFTEKLCKDCGLVHAIYMSCLSAAKNEYTKITGLEYYSQLPVANDPGLVVDYPEIRFSKRI